MRNHKIGCRDCRRKVCCCPRRPLAQSSCICPPGPPGPMGPAGPPGSDGSSVFTGGPNTEKWSGLLVVADDLDIEPTAAFTAFEAGTFTYLTDTIIAAAPANLLIAPNYPSTSDGITWDELTAAVRSFGAATLLPGGVAVVAQMVVNAGQPDERICLEVVFEPGPAGLFLPIFGGGTGPLIDRDQGLCTVAPDETYDVRVGLRNTGLTTATLTAEVTVEASATGRSSAA